MTSLSTLDRDHTHSPTGSRRLRPSTGTRIVEAAVALGLAGLVVYPLLRVLRQLVGGDEGYSLAPFWRVITDGATYDLLWSTLTIVVASGLIAIVLGTLLAWINVRTNAGSGLLGDALPLIPLVVPPIAGAVSWILLLSDRGGLLNAWLRDLLGIVGVSLETGPFNIYSREGIIFVYAIYMVPYVYLLVVAGLRNVDPALEEQSKICGRGSFKTMLKVTIPSIRPSLGAALLLVVWFGIELYSVASIIGPGAQIDVLSVRIVDLLRNTYPPQMATAVGLSAFIVLSVGGAWILQRRVLKRTRHATLEGKGHKATPHDIGIWKWPARGVVYGYVMVSTVLPMGGLLIVTLNGYWTPDIEWGSLSLQTMRETVFEDPTTKAALRNSVLLGLVGATVGVILAAVISLLVKRGNGPLGKIIDALVKLPAATSTVVLAIGFILAFNGPPFELQGTLIILLMAYLVIYIPLASISADAAASQVGRQLPEASRVSGAGAFKTFRRIDLPLMLPGLVGGWALLFVHMANDVTVSVMLANNNTPVVGFQVMEIFEYGTYGKLAALALCQTFLSSLVVVVMLALTRRRGARGGSRVGSAESPAVAAP